MNMRTLFFLFFFYSLERLAQTSKLTITCSIITSEYVESGTHSPSDIVIKSASRNIQSTICALRIRFVLRILLIKIVFHFFRLCYKHIELRPGCGFFSVASSHFPVHIMADSTLESLDAKSDTQSIDSATSKVSKVFQNDDIQKAIDQVFSSQTPTPQHLTNTALQLLYNFCFSSDLLRLEWFR